jgi:hypothetical protein
MGGNSKTVDVQLAGSVRVGENEVTGEEYALGLVRDKRTA